jgi:hypothetical protein
MLRIVRNSDAGYHAPLAIASCYVKTYIGLRPTSLSEIAQGVEAQSPGTLD